MTRGCRHFPTPPAGPRITPHHRQVRTGDPRIPADTVGVPGTPFVSRGSHLSSRLPLCTPPRPPRDLTLRDVSHHNAVPPRHNHPPPPPADRTGAVSRSVGRHTPTKDRIFEMSDLHTEDAIFEQLKKTLSSISDRLPHTHPRDTDAAQEFEASSRLVKFNKMTRGFRPGCPQRSRQPPAGHHRNRGGRGEGVAGERKRFRSGRSGPAPLHRRTPGIRKSCARALPLLAAQP
jgi:hypothetical protein